MVAGPVCVRLGSGGAGAGLERVRVVAARRRTTGETAVAVVADDVGQVDAQTYEGDEDGDGEELK